MLKKQRRIPKQARAIQKYNEVLDASAHVLQQCGYDKTTVQEISLESGHPYATIYQYFSNKDEILLAWLERFINSSLYGLSNLIAAKKEAKIEEYIDDAVSLAIKETVKAQPTLSALFGSMPMVSSRLVELMEQRTLSWVNDAFGLVINENSSDQSEQNLLTTIRAGNGYWLQLALNTERRIDIEKETKNFATLVKTLLNV
jgi:AcrR family transcriptional regulator